MNIGTVERIKQIENRDMGQEKDFELWARKVSLDEELHAQEAESKGMFWSELWDVTKGALVVGGVSLGFYFIFKERKT